MLNFAERIAPLLAELDETVPLHHPVATDDLLPLFKKHSGIPEIVLWPIATTFTMGVHVRQADDGAIHIFYRQCVAHKDQDMNPGCPGCQYERFLIAKELSHTLDCDVEKVAPADVEDKLLDELLKGTWSDDPLAQSDHLGRTWALELLVRYRCRVQMNGAGALAASVRLTAARTSDDYSELARQFGVPQFLIRHAFGEGYMNHMKAIRLRVKLPVGA